MPSIKLLILYLVSILILTGIPADHVLADDTGCCEGYKFPRDKSGKVGRANTVKVIQQNTPVYPTKRSSSPITHLPFNKSLSVVDVTSSRVRVRYTNSTKSLGWIERSALLCAIIPLKSSSGLEKKFYIRTATEERKSRPGTVKAYPSPDLKDCDGMCRELSRFSGYYVFDYDKKNKSYLLGDVYRIDDTTRLVGWVNAGNGFLWETAYGLRPGENLKFPTGHEMAGQEKTICAYKTIEDALHDRKCQPILGGKRWFLIGERIPIIGRVEQRGKSFYKVILPLAGTYVKEDEKNNKIQVNPDLLGENLGINAIVNLKHIDVMFLIDGTRSMGPYIDEIRGKYGQKSGVVHKIIDTFKNDDQFKEAQFRFGFRIYRDAYAGPKELGEGLPLSDKCELSEARKKKNLKSFYKKISNVKATSDYIDKKDDYPENLFGGIKQAIEDLKPCSNNMKILFVIGDGGYDESAQQTPVKLNTLVKGLKGDKKHGFKNIVTFFLQVPDYRRPEHPIKSHAYTLFREQAHEILRKISPSNLSDEIDTYFMETDDKNLGEKIIDGVKKFSNIVVINELVLDLRGGSSLTGAIQRLRGSKEYKNIPGLFWDIVEQASAKNLGKQYTNRIYDKILDGYIPITNDITVDVMLKFEDLSRWLLLMSSLMNLHDMGTSSTQIREAFTFALKDALAKIIRKPEYKDAQETLEKYLMRKGGLPVRDTSPLLRYSLAELKNSNVVPDCEIIRLVSWINNSKQMMEIVSKGIFRPKYREEPFPGECPKGKGIPFISGDIRPIPLDKNPGMRFDHSFQKALVFWIPKEYLP